MRRQGPGSAQDRARSLQGNTRKIWNGYKFALQHSDDKKKEVILLALKKKKSQLDLALSPPLLR